MEVYIKYGVLLLTALFVVISFGMKYKTLSSQKKAEIRKELKIASIFTDVLQILGFIMLFIGVILWNKPIMIFGLIFIASGLLIESIKQWKKNKGVRNSLLVRVIAACLGTFVLIKFF